jgi:simple sugar transport system permease protein
METGVDVTPSSPKKKQPQILTLFSGILGTALVPILAVFSALVIGGLLIVVTEAPVYAAFGEGGLGAGLAAAWQVVIGAYGAMFSGSLGDANAISESLVASTPFIFAGLAVALGFRGGLFNIGAEGQLLVAAGVSVVIGFSSPEEFLGGLLLVIGIVRNLALLVTVVALLAWGYAWAKNRFSRPKSAALFHLKWAGSVTILAALLGAAILALLPVVPANWSPWIHLPLAVLGGTLGGAIYGAIPGYLKALTGAHEVINTIMMNWVAFLFFSWTFTGPLRREGGDVPVTDEILPSAYLPQLFEGFRLHWGFFLALTVAFGVWWLLFKTTIGFEIRTVGANPNAARYGGIHITRTTVLTMALSGGLAGLAGTTQLLGLNHFLADGFSPGFGFDAIALALLGKSHPLGVVLASLLFGTLRNGATRMQSIASVPVDIISVVQALVIIFIAAPAIVRWIYRVRVKAEEMDSTTFTRGWGA